jgi:DNA sulfur modification protein DndE
VKLAKIRLTKDASNRLRFLAGKTGLTPNLLCRIGFCLSLEELKAPDPADFPEEDALYIALLIISNVFTKISYLQMKYPGISERI